MVPPARAGSLSYAVGVSLRRAIGALLAILLVLSACAAAEPSSFDPGSPCTEDGAFPGAYPDLEALIPSTWEDRGPDTLDSGRNCSQANLGALAAAGFEEIHFAGGAWDFGGERALVMAVFTADGLTADHIADFYAASARTANRTAVVGESRPTLADRPGRRLDTKTGDRLQTVLVWPAADPDVVNVIISNDLPDPKILEAVDAFGGG
jgi:hypothetical protein